MTTVNLDIDLEKFRYSLVGNGYLLEEVKVMTPDELIQIFKRQVNDTILAEYHKSIRYGLLDGTRL